MNYKVSLDQIINISEARENLSRLVDQVGVGKTFIITKGGKPKSALIDLNLLREMERKRDFLEMEKITQSFQQAFRKYLRQRGYDPDKISEKKASRILASL